MDPSGSSETRATPAGRERKKPSSLLPHEPMAELPERYESLGAIARGGWGEVLRVRDRALDRVLAMKILASEHREADSLLARFMHEAQVTAALEHPGIVPVHDRGVLPDGRPWFTMKEVRGRTLLELLVEPNEADRGNSTRRFVEILLRVAETVGYAHERGVIHRDLKPGNIMVGEFGEVLVLDWGIARPGTLFGPEVSSVTSQELVGDDEPLTGVGELLGTVAYMSPEQARGIGEPLTPASDVFALGLILYEILVGEKARAADRIQAWAMAAMGSVPAIAPSRGLPDELCTIVLAATQIAPDDRLPNGMALARRLRAWLDGSLGRERAAALVTQATHAIRGLESLRQHRDALRADARGLLSRIHSHGSVAEKRPAWALEDQAEALHREIAIAEAVHIEGLRAALELDPDHEPAHRALASVYRAQILDAEARHAPAEVAQAELRLRRHARSEDQRFLRGMGRVLLEADIEARVQARRYVIQERRLVGGPPRDLGATPIDVELEAGSWRLELEKPGARPTVYLLQVQRDQTHRLVRPGTSASIVRCIGALAAAEVHVTAGWTIVGGDPHAIEPVPARTVWIDDFVIERTSVTYAAYLAFLDDLGPVDALPFVPRWQLGTAHDPDALPAVEWVGHRFEVVRPAEGGRTVAPDWPVTSINWFAARAYAAWRAKRTGLPWRLPDELEWEKAARGADGRAHPWGDFSEPTWSRIVGSTPEVPSRAPVGTHPIDESPYGVLDMGGNVRNWCDGPWTPDGPVVERGILVRASSSPADFSLRVIRGGSWSSVASHARCASRFAGRPEERFAAVGLRLVRSV